MIYRASLAAHGILCPNLSTVEEARALVSFSKFPAATKVVPGKSGELSGQVSGTRGVGSPFAPAVFRQTLAEYIRTANRNTFVAAQIETAGGLENCEEIAKVEGIGEYFLNLQSEIFNTSYNLDMLFIGSVLVYAYEKCVLSIYDLSPNDLASSMGYPALEHESIPEVQTAIKRILAAAHAAGKYAGMFCLSSDQVRRRFKQGCMSLSFITILTGILLIFFFS